MRDADVRNAVKLHLAQEHLGDTSTLIVEEMPIWAGTVRIDLAVINGELSGYELKSDRDTLSRLPFQADIYSRVFDKVTLVSGSKHATKAQLQIPEWWGLFTAFSTEEAILLEPVRISSQNPFQDPYLIAELLRKDEAIGILDSYKLATGYRSKSIRVLHEKLAAELPLNILKHEVRLALKARKDWLRQR